jgi:adenylylsulfate kinase-like enzyme
VVIVITGPIASGKSTVARELAHRLEAEGVRAAVLDLDVVHDRLMADGVPPGDAAWAAARREAATAAGDLSDDGVLVIAEGSFNLPRDREAFRNHLGPLADPVFVTLQVSFDEALRRAERDPTRGRSRDPRFLSSYFAGRRDVLAAAPTTDIVIDTEVVSATSAAARIAGQIRNPGVGSD